jgi:hypothetical protein
LTIGDFIPHSPTEVWHALQFHFSSASSLLANHNGEYAVASENLILKVEIAEVRVNGRRRWQGARGKGQVLVELEEV